MSNLLTTIKSKATWVILLSAFIGGLNAVIPLLHPKTAEVVSVILAVIGAILHGLEKHDALMQEPPQQ